MRYGTFNGSLQPELQRQRCSPYMHWSRHAPARNAPGICAIGCFAYKQRERPHMQPLSALYSNRRHLMFASIQARRAATKSRMTFS